MTETLTIPSLDIGDPVEIKDYEASDGRTYLVEIRMLRASKRYFPHYQRPCRTMIQHNESGPSAHMSEAGPVAAGSSGMRWSYAFPSRSTVRRAFNTARRHIEFMLEDAPGWNMEREDEAP